MTSGEMRRLAGQLLWVGFPGLEPPPEFLSRVQAGDVGGVTLFKPNVAGIDQIAALTRTLHEAAPADAPLLLSVDQEGGRVQRVRAPATEWPPMLRLGERWRRDPDAARADARSLGRALGDELAALGFDVDFAPVLDVHTNAANPVIGDRAFAETPEGVIALAGAFADGLADAGVISCGKHFPGHGDTTEDSHLALPRVPHAAERIRAVELAPFHAVRTPLVMTAHVIFDAIDPDLPATLSDKVLQGILRGELGYDGLIVSDDMEMKAIADNWGFADAIERGLVAGCDAFLVCHSQALQVEAQETLVRAAERSSRVRERLAESAARHEALKRGHFSAGRARPGLDVIGAAAHRALADRFSRAG